MSLPYICLKKREDRRVRGGHPWIFSNEIDTTLTPLKSFAPGDEALIMAADKTVFGVAYINPHSLISGRIFSQNPKDRLDQDFIIQRLRSALASRDRLFAKPYYRLIFGEADGLPGLVVDRFGDHIVAQINTAGMECKKELVISALCTVLPATRSILFRNDSATRTQEGLPLYVEAAFGDMPAELTLEENGILFTVPGQEGQKTGWFYDHRLNRARLQDYVKDLSVLDVFSYAGGFGVQAAVFGAKQVDCIEASAAASNYIKKNAALNAVTDRVNVITADAFVAMKQLQQANKQYDVIILDPPAFVKKSKDRKEGLIAYQRLNEQAFRLLSPNGILFSCSCSMHVSWDDLMLLVQHAAHRANSQIQVLERGHQGPDHPLHIAIPETDYLKALVIRKVI